MKKLIVFVVTLLCGGTVFLFGNINENVFIASSSTLVPTPSPFVCPFPCSPTESCLPVVPECQKTPVIPKSNLFRGVDPVQGEYIVIFEENGCSGNCRQVEENLKKRVAQIEKGIGGKVIHTYSRVTQGFLIKGITQTQALEISQLKDVLYVVENSKAETHQCNLSGLNTQFTVSVPGLWGLDRIDNNIPKTVPSGLKDNYKFKKKGDGVRVYVLDTGINADHTQFAVGTNTRVKPLYDYYAATSTSASTSTQDCTGHGTNVAGIIGGKDYGVAKNVTLFSVRISNNDSSQTTCGEDIEVDSIIKGLEAIIAKECDDDSLNCNSDKRAVANMSVGVNGCSFILDNVVKNFINNGIPLVLSAGNKGQNAIHYSPGRVKEAITVGATMQGDEIFPNSNWGCPVDVFAPGYKILTSSSGSDCSDNDCNKKFEGTSAAAPFVTGLIALLIEGNSFTPTTIESRIKCNSNGGMFGSNNKKCLSIANRVKFNTSSVNIMNNANAVLTNANTTKNIVYKNRCNAAKVMR